jgi:hypothetical protein
MSSNNLSEQEEVIRTLKAKNDTSDRQIWLYLRIIMAVLLSCPSLFVSTPVIR